MNIGKLVFDLAEGITSTRKIISSYPEGTMFHNYVYVYALPSGKYAVDHIGIACLKWDQVPNQLKTIVEMYSRYQQGALIMCSPPEKYGTPEGTPLSLEKVEELKGTVKGAAVLEGKLSNAQQFCTGVASLAELFRYVSGNKASQQTL